MDKISLGSDNLLNRRNFLGLATGFCSSFSSILSAQSPEKSEQYTPEQLKNISHTFAQADPSFLVTNILTPPGMKKLLVHVGHIHQDPTKSHTAITREFAQDVISVQKNIAYFFVQHIQKYSPPVFLESQTVTFEQKHYEWLCEQSQIWDNVHEISASDWLYFFGRAGAILHTLGVSLPATESRKELEEGLHVIQNPASSPAEIAKEVFRDREIHVLGEALKQSHQIPVTFFGYEHDFTDVINKHNARNPSETIGYLKLSPRSIWEGRVIANVKLK